MSESAKMATELYREAITVPFMAKFVVFAKRQAELESRLRVFCMTDDKMDKTLESQVIRVERQFSKLLMFEKKICMTIYKCAYWRERVRACGVRW